MFEFTIEKLKGLMAEKEAKKAELTFILSEEEIKKKQTKKKKKFEIKIKGLNIDKAEYQKNLGINTPTNRILTSMCSIERLLFLLKYS